MLQLSSDLSALCEWITWMEDIRIIVLSFGGEMSYRDTPSEEGVSEPVGFVEPVAALKQPVIAVLQGNILGPWLELALACDLRIATQGACFGLSQVTEGHIPSNGGTQRLPRLIGQNRAMQMILTGESVDADEAQRIGLINRVIEPESIMAASRDMAREMSTKSPVALSYAKEALYSGRDLTLEQGLSKELDLYLQLFSTQDRTEGITAFREKRTPEFKGE